MSYLGEDIRKLGFGLMRLPQTDGVIDIEQTKEMVDILKWNLCSFRLIMQTGRIRQFSLEAVMK